LFLAPNAASAQRLLICTKTLRFRTDDVGVAEIGVEFRFERLLVTCPALPEVTTFGKDEAAAIRHATDAIEEALAARIAEGLDIPAPTRSFADHAVELPLMVGLKTSLYRCLRQDAITRAELTRRLKWNRESVDRLFRLDHASRLDQIEAAFRALDKKVDLRIRETA
jgi:antitoxin HicB